MNRCHITVRKQEEASRTRDALAADLKSTIRACTQLGCTCDTFGDVDRPEDLQVYCIYDKDYKGGSNFAEDKQEFAEIVKAYGIPIVVDNRVLFSA